MLCALLQKDVGASAGSPTRTSGITLCLQARKETRPEYSGRVFLDVAAVDQIADPLTGNDELSNQSAGE
jgi:hypothetical protein